MHLKYKSNINNNKYIPSDKNKISAILSSIGLINDINLKRYLRLLGSSFLPTKPRFIVIKIPNPAYKGIF